MEMAEQGPVIDSEKRDDSHVATSVNYNNSSF